MYRSVVSSSGVTFAKALFLKYGTRTSQVSKAVEEYLEYWGLKETCKSFRAEMKAVRPASIYKPRPFSGPDAVGPVPGNRFAVDITPCQSSPADRGCDLGWLECMGDFVTRRKDGLVGCGPTTQRSEVATEEDYWHSEVEWHNANTLIVRPQ